MITNAHVNAALLAQVLGTSVAMGAPALAMLASEIADDPAGRGYAEAAPAEILELINAPYTIDNPTPQGRVAKTVLSQEEFKVFRSTIQGAWSVTQSPAKEPMRDLVTVALPSLSDFASVSLADPLVTGALAALVETQIVSQELVDAYTTQPDPAWSPTVGRQARAVALFGSGATIELSDLVAAGV
ncbi:MAG TPA: hypothetical protein PK308_05255 [Phycisphaerales bacterium]|nr:hypothetical protein [Phycisphaerales bacterium]